MRSKSLRAQLSINMIVDKHHVAHTLSFKDKIKAGLAMENNIPILCLQHGCTYSNMMSVVTINQPMIWNGIPF